MREALLAGDIIRDRWPLRMSDHLNLYLGSGRCGACFDAYGLMNNGFRGRPLESLSNTVLMHADHWHRGGWGLDYWLPIARLGWDALPPGPVSGYRQELELYDGLLRTELRTPHLRYQLSNTFHPDRRDLLAVELRYETAPGGKMPALLLAPVTDLTTHYNQHVTGEARTVEAGSGWWLCRIEVGTAESTLALRVISSEGQAVLEPTGEGLRISFAGERGRHFLLIATAAVRREAGLCEEIKAVAAPEQFLAEAAQAWHRRWGTAFIQVPVPEYQALWARSLYYVLASYAPDVRSPAAPMGWTGNGWPFHFPQDVSYIHAALLRLGHLDIARSWVEFYRGYLDDMLDYTRRIYQARGAMWAWEFPIGRGSRLLSDGYPNWYQFEIHNAAYPARMARETALYLQDDKWAREVAWPIVRESARFYGSIAHIESGDTWGIHVEPSMGQDEMGGHNARNYLCALYSAQYTLEAALAMAERLGLSDVELGHWQEIVTDGLSFGRLLDRNLGILATCEGVQGAEQIGKEKHPVQLNPLTFLPLGEIEEHVRRAYERRYELCAGVREKTYYGWTLAAYWLAASHMEDSRGLLRELGQALPGRYVDPDWIQIFESSGSRQAAYYVTSNGLYLQALNDAFVSDYWGETAIGTACPKEWEEVRFQRLRTVEGELISGKKIEGEWEVTTEQV